MGQVPHTSSLLIIGNGRLARHLRHYFQLLGHSILFWNRHSPLTELENLLKNSDRVGLLVSDRAIAPVFEELRPLFGKKLIFHCSGSLSHPEIESAHPLMTFAESLYPLETYKSVTFVTEQSRAPFAQIFPELVNPCIAIPSSQKALYHALCVCAGNLTTLLQQEALKEFKTLAIPASAVEIFVRQTLSNLFQNPESALTGPIARGDIQTIQKNLSALEGQPLQGIYKQFLTLFPDIKNDVEGTTYEHS